MSLHQTRLYFWLDCTSQLTSKSRASDTTAEVNGTLVAVDIQFSFHWVQKTQSLALSPAALPATVTRRHNTHTELTMPRPCSLSANSATFCVLCAAAWTFVRSYLLAGAGGLLCEWHLRVRNCLSATLVLSAQSYVWLWHAWNAAAKGGGKGGLPEMAGGTGLLSVCFYTVFGIINGAALPWRNALTSEMYVMHVGSFSRSCEPTRVHVLSRARLYGTAQC